MPKSIYSIERATLRELLRELRQKAGYRQIDLAAKLGRPQSFVSKYEAGERRLDLIEIRDVCASLNIGLDEFVSILEQRLENRRDEAKS